MLDRVNNLIKQLEEIKRFLNLQIKPLEDEIKLLRIKYKEIQRVLISRKVIKIIIKYIIINSVKFFTMEDNTCLLNNLQVKNSKLNSKKVMDIINSLIVKNKKINSKVHIVGGIDKIIELLYSFGNLITLGDLIELIDLDNETKKKIKKIIETEQMDHINIYYDIIGNDPELKEMLVDLKEKLSQ